jgi:membrane-bound metal-dependent hydrolase YbcI (DUF457 family)
MPLTPFHLGPSSWIGLLFFRLFHLPTLIVASVIVDIEPFLVIAFDLDYPLHGYLHTFLGGTVVAILLAIVMYLLRNPTRRLMEAFKLAQTTTFSVILWTALFGVYLHILLDAPLYKDIQPFYPLNENPLYGILSGSTIYLFCGISFLIGLIFYILKMIVVWRKSAEE